MAKAAIQSDSASAGAVAVTYKPLEPTDPNVTIWNHVEFLANTPVMLDPAAHFVVTDIPKPVTLPDGTMATKTQPTRISMIELAKGNSSFEVDGFPRARRIKPAGRVPQPGAEWEGTDRDDLVRQMAQVKDFNPGAGALVIS